jgi:hypothetical protein
MKWWHGKSLVGHLIEVEIEWRGHTAVPVSSDGLSIDAEGADGRRLYKRRGAVSEPTDGAPAEGSRFSRSTSQRRRARVLGYSSILNRHLVRWENSHNLTSSEPSEGAAYPDEAGEWLALHNRGSQSESSEPSGRSSKTVTSFEVLVDLSFKRLPGEPLKGDERSGSNFEGSSGMDIIRPGADSDHVCGACHAHISTDPSDSDDDEDDERRVVECCGSCRKHFHESCSPQIIVPWNPNATKAVAKAADSCFEDWTCWSCSGSLSFLPHMLSVLICCISAFFDSM